MSIESLPLYYRTVRHLKRRQIKSRILKLIFRSGKVSRFDGKIRFRDKVQMVPGVAKTFVKSGFNEFSFLNVFKQLDAHSMDWTSLEMSKLWRYNLHYFDYLNDKDRPYENKAFLINDWIARNPQGTPDAWEPFPVSLQDRQLDQVLSDT